MGTPRIGLVCPYSLAVPGGVQGQVLGLARALRSFGHEVIVVAPGPSVGPVHASDPGDAPGGSAFVSAGRSFGWRANGSVAPVALAPRSIGRATGALRRGRFDVVHLHEPFAPAVSYGWLADRRAPTVGTLHRAGGPGLYRALRPLGRIAAGRLDAVRAVSAQAAGTAAGLFDQPVPLLFNGVEMPVASDEPADEPDGPGAPRKSPLVVFASRHELRKGLGTLLEAWDRLVRSGRAGAGAACWILSTGPETAALRARFLGTPGLRWLGVVSEHEKRRILTQADVLCAPSSAGESFGVVLLEAMAFRTVVVASDIPGYRDAAGGHAALVPPGDAWALADRLEAVLVDVARHCGVASEQSLDAAAAHAGSWSMDALARCYLDVYEEAATAFGKRAQRHRRVGGTAVGIVERP